MASGADESTLNIDLINDNFFPEINLGDYLTKYPLHSEYEDAVIKNAVVIEMYTVNNSLIDFKKELVNLGFNSLQSYTVANSKKIDEEEILITLYKTAIYLNANIRLLSSIDKKYDDEKAMIDDINTWMNQSQDCIYKLYKEVGLADEINSGSVHVSLI